MTKPHGPELIHNLTTTTHKRYGDFAWLLISKANNMLTGVDRLILDGQIYMFLHHTNVFGGFVTTNRFS